MSTRFDRVASQMLQLAHRDSEIVASVRARSQPAWGWERARSAFDYLFLTKSDLCFLAPNPTPPGLITVSLEHLAEVSYASDAYVRQYPPALERWKDVLTMFKINDEAPLLEVEGKKGWGSRIEGVKLEEPKAIQFFGVWDGWVVPPARADFIRAVAAMAGLDEYDTTLLRDAGIVAWRRTQSIPPDPKHSETTGPEREE